MPWYRMDDGKGATYLVHMRGTNLPGACVAHDHELGKRCLRMGGFLCDGHAGGGKTCDAALCKTHAKEVGEDRHLCPVCDEAEEAIMRMQRCRRINS